MKKRDRGMSDGKAVTHNFPQMDWLPASVWPTAPLERLPYGFYCWAWCPI